jgi:hypothetical protein
MDGESEEAEQQERSPDGEATSGAMDGESEEAEQQERSPDGEATSGSVAAIPAERHNRNDPRRTARR